MNRLTVCRRATALLLFLAVGLGAITIRTMNETERWSERVNGIISDYALADRSIQLDLLNERAGLLRNYDQISQSLIKARVSLDQLKRSELRSETHLLVDELVAKNDRREDLVQQFNSNNALLQTSLSYFTYHTGRTASEQVLINRVLKLTLDTSPKAVEEARLALQEMPQPSAAAPGDLPLSYAGLLIQIVPEMDRLLSTIRAGDMQKSIEALQMAVGEELLGRSRRVRQLELVLGATIILLLITAASFLTTQRLQMSALEAWAANEQLNAQIAIPLIDASPSTFRSRVQEATDRLAFHIGARRLQLALPGMGDPAQFLEAGTEMKPDWLANLAHAAALDAAWADNRVIASLDEGAVGPNLATAMSQTDIRQLVLIRTPMPFRVMIGFEPKDFAKAQRSDYLTALSSAMIAVGHSARRKVMQEERARLEQSLAEKRRMANLGAVASGIAHNFNNIIGAIGGFSEIGRKRTKAGSTARRNFDEILETIEHGRQLIDAILNYAKRRPSNKVLLDLNELLEQTLRMLDVSSSSRAAFSFSPSEEHYNVYASKVDLQQVILNLCNNAAQAGGGGGVKLKLHCEEVREKRQMSHDSLFPGTYAVISITDTGPGISKVVLRQLFDPFFTTKPGGTGLGLSTAWEIIQQHGGTIHVENTQEAGARFSVWLPEIATNEQGMIPGDGARILIITDPERLRAEEDMLAELGYEPLGLPLDAEKAKITESARTADVVLVATSQSQVANELVLGIAPLLDHRPIFLATVDSDGWQHSIPATSLTFPLRADQLAYHLSQVVPRRSDPVHKSPRDGPQGEKRTV